MQHLAIDRWNRYDSFLHRRDARAKLLALLAILIALTAGVAHPLARAGATFGLLLVLITAAKLPLGGLLKRSLALLPFCATFALFSALAGDVPGAARLVVRSYVSGLAALLFAATTPLPELLRGLAQWHAPRYVLTVLQLLYQYLAVLIGEGQQIRVAARSRGGFRGAAGFRAAAGALSVLFARSHARAEAIHQAMLSRGYAGTLPVRRLPRFGWADAGLVACSLGFAIALRAGLAR